MMPAGPPPMMQQVVASGFGLVGISGDEDSRTLQGRQRVCCGLARIKGSQSAGVWAR